MENRYLFREAEKIDVKNVFQLILSDERTIKSHYPMEQHTLRSNLSAILL